MKTLQNTIKIIVIDLSFTDNLSFVLLGNVSFMIVVDTDA